MILNKILKTKNVDDDDENENIIMLIHSQFAVKKSIKKKITKIKNFLKLKNFSKLKNSSKLKFITAKL